MTTAGFADGKCFSCWHIAAFLTYTSSGIRNGGVDAAVCSLLRCSRNPDAFWIFQHNSRVLMRQRACKRFHRIACVRCVSAMFWAPVFSVLFACLLFVITLRAVSGALKQLNTHFWNSVAVNCRGRRRRSFMASDFFYAWYKGAKLIHLTTNNFDVIALTV